MSVTMTSLLILLVLLLLAMLCVDGRLGQSKDSTDGSCNPVVDMLFVLDRSSYVTQEGFQAQKNFLRDILQNHQSPKGAVRMSAMVCVNNTVSSVPFTDSVRTLQESLDKLVSSDTVDTSSKQRHCLESVNFKFKAEARDSVFRIAVVLRAGDKWSDSYTKSEAEKARTNRVVMVVVAIGMKDFETLSALQLLASEDGTFFVVSNYTDLKSLATSLSRGSCRPITLNLSSENNFVVQTRQPVKKTYRPCIRQGARMFQRYIRGLGYIRGLCSSSQTLDMNRCQCI